MQKVLIVDNYDSFTYNLAHYFEALGAVVEVYRNDAVPESALENCTHLVLSPGPGLPQDAGAMPEIIQKYWAAKPLLGVCLGMQALALFFGGQLYNLEQVMHGQQMEVWKMGQSVQFDGIPETFQVGLYHSWAVSQQNLPPTLRPTAISAQNVLMAFAHETLPIWAVQFHPESVLTPEGRIMLRNFLSISRG